MAKDRDKWLAELKATADQIAKKEHFIDRIYYDSRNIPTLAYGQSRGF